MPRQKKQISMEVIEQYRAGEALGPIAKRIGVGTNTLADFLREAGVLRSKAEAKSLGWQKMTVEAREARRPKHIGRLIDCHEVMQLFESGKNQSQIAKKLGVNRLRVKAILEKNGFAVPMKTQDPNVTIDVIPGLVCEFCATRFVQRGNNQRACEVCLPLGLPNKFRKYAHRYGVTKPIWDMMLADQGGHCALCDRPAVLLDHDHDTGNARGALCNGCNSSLGQIERDRSWALKALSYLEIHDVSTDHQR